jgi:hypothetical protein
MGAQQMHLPSTHPPAMRVVGVENRPSRTPYIVTGAVVGAGIAALGFMLDDSQDAMFEGLVIAVVVPASALLGAGLGWLIYEIKH